MGSVHEVPLGLYRGRVDGAESGPCEARIVVTQVPGGCLAFDYEAIGHDGLQHAEHSVLTADALHVAHSEVPGMHVFRRVSDSAFDGPASGPYAQRIEIAWDGEVLGWTWCWAPRGEPLREQSRATVRPAHG